MIEITPMTISAKPIMRVFLISFSIEIGSNFQLKGLYRADCISMVFLGFHEISAPKRMAITDIVSRTQKGHILPTLHEHLENIIDDN